MQCTHCSLPYNPAPRTCVAATAPPWGLESLLFVEGIPISKSELVKEKILFLYVYYTTIYMYIYREREIVITHKYGHKHKPDLLWSFLFCVRYNILLHHSFTWRVFLETLVHWTHIHHRAGPTPTSSVSRSNHAWNVFVLLPTRPSAPAFYGDRLILEVWSSFDLMSSKRSFVTWHVSHLVEATHLSK